MFIFRWDVKVTFTAIFSFLLATSISLPVLAMCPSIEHIEGKINRLTQKKTIVQDVQPFDVPTICEVTVRSGSRAKIFYTDMEGRYFFFGNIVDTVSGKNLTNETLSSLNRFTSQELADIETLTAFSIGSPAGKVLYYVTDPQCPYCQRGVEDLKKVVKANNIQVRFLLFPLQSHKGAKEQCVSVVCDKKDLAYFENGYRSKNQCEEGVMLIDATLDLLKKKGNKCDPNVYFQRRPFSQWTAEAAGPATTIGVGC